MRLHITVDVVQQHVGSGYVINDGRKTVRRNHHVRLNAATVANLTATGRLERFRQAVRQSLRRAVRIQMTIVIRLNTASAGNIIAARRHLQTSVIRHFTNHLYQPLTVSTLTDYHGTVPILPSSGNDFGRGCRRTVHQHSHRNIHVQGFFLRVVFRIDRSQLAFRVHDLLPAGHKKVRHLYGLAQRAARIATHVYHQRLGTLLLQIDHGPADIARTTVDKTFEINITDTV